MIALNVLSLKSLPSSSKVWGQVSREAVIYGGSEGSQGHLCPTLGLCS